MARLRSHGMIDRKYNRGIPKRTVLLQLIYQIHQPH